MLFGTESDLARIRHFPCLKFWREDRMRSDEYYPRSHDELPAKEKNVRKFAAPFRDSTF